MLTEHIFFHVFAFDLLLQDCTHCVFVWSVQDLLFMFEALLVLIIPPLPKDSEWGGL